MCKSAMKGTVDILTKINSRMKIIVCHWNVFIYFFTFNSIDDIAKYFNCKLLNINMYDKILLKHFFSMCSHRVGMKPTLSTTSILWKAT